MTAETSSKIISGALSEQIVQQTKLHLNLDQDAIVITEDRVRLILLGHLSNLEAKRRWHTPSGILLALATTFATTTFQDAFGLSSATWRAIFVLLTIGAGVWLVGAAVRAFRANDVEDVVSSMKKASASVTGQASGT